MYPEGTISNTHTLSSSVRSYLQGVSIARQSINRTLAELSDEIVDGVVIDIGGSGAFRGFINEERYIVMDVIHRPQNTITADGARMPFRSKEINCVLYRF